MPWMNTESARVVFATILCCFGARDALAADAPPAGQPPAERDTRGVLTFVNENDLYAFTNSDRHYTNGVRLAWLSADADLPEWAKALGDELPFLDPGARRRIGWALGHNVYTPEDKARRDLIRDDRPYAGWLYAGFALQSESPNRLDTLELDVGIVGPAAFGREVQNHWHRVIGADPASGWNNQLKNEPGVALVFERKWRKIWELPTGGGFGFDAIPHISASLGNVATYGAVGATLRFGHDLAADFGPPRIRPALPGSGSFKLNDGLAGYLFIGAEGRAIARDVFLDGNTFAESHSVSKKPIVGDFQAGFALLLNTVRVSFTQVVRTREFDGQNRPDFFGSISLSLRF
jgi:hypothetical protein